MGEDFDEWYVRTHASVAPGCLLGAAMRAVAAEALDEAFVRAYERWNRVRKRRREAQILARIDTNDSDAEDERADVELAPVSSASKSPLP